MTKADRKRIETIARACGWEYRKDDGYIQRPENGGGFEYFDPYDSTEEWFRAFDAMGYKFLTVNKMIFVSGADMWTVKVDGDYYAEHPDRMTAMGEALYLAALKKLGGGGGMQAMNKGWFIIAGWTSHYPHNSESVEIEIHEAFPRAERVWKTMATYDECDNSFCFRDDGRERRARAMYYGGVVYAWRRMEAQP